MKANKKSILGMLVAIVMSLGIMQGIEKNQSDGSLQQQAAALVCTYASYETGGDVLCDMAGVMSAACLTFATGGAAVVCL